MIMRRNDSDIYEMISNVIRDYLNGGFKIDAKESLINSETDKHCTFKAVLKDTKDTRNKIIITLEDKSSGDNKEYTYRKVEMVNNIKYNEETRTFISTKNKKETEKELPSISSRDIISGKFKSLKDIINISNQRREERLRKDLNNRVDNKKESDNFTYDKLVDEMHHVAAYSSEYQKCPQSSGVEDENEFNNPLYIFVKYYIRGLLLCGLHLIIF